MVFADSFLVILELITVGCGILGGKCGHGLTSRPQESASDGFFFKLAFSFVWLSEWVRCWEVAGSPGV